MIMRCVLTSVALLLLPVSGLARDVPLMLKQERDGAAVQGLTQAEFASLGDPLFRFLLKQNAAATTLDGILAALEPSVEKRRLFIVDERIASEMRAGASRRGVVAFTGINSGEPLKGNVMLSITLLPDGKALEAIEAWGWDNQRGRYNYYKLDALGALPGELAWKFRGTSENADLLTSNERAGTCLACHTTGAPVMKELVFPWNNWHSKVGNAFKADYLDPKSTHPAKWSAAATPLFQALAGAEELETDHLIPAFKRFNESRVNVQLLRESATGNRLLINGQLTLTGASRLLRSLFVPTELNLVSSRHPSGSHPFGKSTDFSPNNNIMLPDGFFLNTGLIAGGSGIKGLQVVSATSFRSFAALTQAENRALIEKFKVRLNGEPGDAHFAWLVPTPSCIDTELSDRLVKLGVVTPHFLAAVLSVDLEEPLFSEKRAKLVKYLPEQFSFTPLQEGVDPLAATHDPEKDELTMAVIEKIEADFPSPGSAAEEFKELLKQSDAVRQLDERVQRYANRVQTALGASATRTAELERLFKSLVARRQGMLGNPMFAPLDETGGRLLFPVPASE